MEEDGALLGQNSVDNRVCSEKKQLTNAAARPDFSEEVFLFSFKLSWPLHKIPNTGHDCHKSSLIDIYASLDANGWYLLNNYMLQASKAPLAGDVNGLCNLRKK